MKYIIWNVELVVDYLQCLKPETTKTPQYTCFISRSFKDVMIFSLFKIDKEYPVEDELVDDYLQC